MLDLHRIICEGEQYCGYEIDLKYFFQDEDDWDTAENDPLHTSFIPCNELSLENILVTFPICDISQEIDIVRHLDGDEDLSDLYVNKQERGDFDEWFEWFYEVQKLAPSEIGDSCTMCGSVEREKMNRPHQEHYDWYRRDYPIHQSHGRHGRQFKKLSNYRRDSVRIGHVLHELEETDIEWMFNLKQSVYADLNADI